MKKIILLVTFLLVAAACSTEPPANSPATNANSASTKGPALSEAEMITREKETWDAIRKKDYDGFGKMLSNDYLEIGGDGVFDKAGIIAYVKDLNIADTTFANWKMLNIDKDAAILMYDVTIKGTYKNEGIPPGPYRASSAWINQGGKWVAAFYQETLARKRSSTQPPPAPADSPAAKSSPATSVPATGPDPIANERLIWDAIKNKNYGEFAALLADDAVEIEAEGVYDKAASVKGVSSVDLSHAELSEWRSVKFDADAALVTYLVTDPKIGKERHSTIWVNRNGKWLALFHQGTPLQPTPRSPSKTGLK
jgi:hypothetical protein